MSEKRRDNRNRILREGEYQRKDGRYRFRYIDEDGKEKNVYSWRLDKNDPMPKGKKREPSLREKEKQIEADLFDRIVTNGGNYTVLELVEKYVSLKTGVRHNTVAGYKTVINMLKKESFGNLRIDKVRLSDAKAWLIKLQQIDGRGYSSIHSIRGVLRPAFQMAVDDDLLRKNPFEFELASVIVNDSVTREAITRKQQRDLLKFIQEDKHFSRYYDAIYILFHTGLRISEFCGLTVSEIEYGEMRIKVDHQLQRTAQMQYVIEEPKTDKGIRYVPMTEAVAACFRRIIANRKTPKVEPMVEGYAGFLFYDKDGDNLSEMAIRILDSTKHVDSKLPANSFVNQQVNGVVDWVSIAVDMDNDNGPGNEFDFDMTIGFQGEGFNYMDQVHKINNLRGLAETDTFFMDARWRHLDELIYPDHENAWDLIFKRGEWNRVNFVWDEDGDCKRWERVEFY